MCHRLDRRAGKGALDPHREPVRFRRGNRTDVLWAAGSTQWLAAGLSCFNWRSPGHPSPLRRGTEGFERMRKDLTSYAADILVANIPWLALGAHPERLRRLIVAGQVVAYIRAGELAVPSLARLYPGRILPRVEACQSKFS